MALHKVRVMMDQSRLKYGYCLCQISSSEVILADATSECIGVTSLCVYEVH